MSNVVHFPILAPLPDENGTRDRKLFAAGKAVFFCALNMVHFVLVIVIGLFMPILDKIMGLVIAYQFFRMLFLWKEPDAHAGWTFCLYFFGWVGLLLFLARWNPKKRNFSG
jgi:hypothetical protein